MPHIDLSDKKYLTKLKHMNWTFPVGLAAGMDKNAQAIDFFSKLGFGAIEVGTVTPRPQQGNDKPRLFRYPQEESIRNRMGFNNQGAEQVLKNLKASKTFKSKASTIGVNLGKNKTAPLESAYLDYLSLYKTFAKDADYLVINVSSPNTQGLRELQGRPFLEKIFGTINDNLIENTPPLYIKIAPDLSKQEIVEVIECANDFGLSGIIATNTTIMPEIGEGGVSGKLLTKKAKEVRHFVMEKIKPYPNLELIGVGGISNYQDVKEFFDLGGKAVQIYSSFIFQGPQILKDISLSLPV